MNLKFVHVSDKRNSHYGNASSCMPNTMREKYLDKIHNLNIQKKEFIDGYKSDRLKIKQANQGLIKM